MAQDLFDRDVRVELYRAFVEQGHAPVAAEIAARLGRETLEVEDSLRRLADAHMIVLAPGTPYVWMANPLSALPTPFRVTVDDRRFWGNCIWDALGVVSMLGGTGAVDTWCPDCGYPMHVDVSERAVAEDGGVVHFAVPARHWWDDIGFN